MSNTAADMISRIISDETTPSPQVGEATVFKRRTPPESELPAGQDLDALYDFIRMLDADTYPRAYLDHAGLRFEFSRAALRDGHLVADVKISPLESKNA